MLSVICPIYNEAKYIEVCIQSILLQDFPKDDLEVLFIDGMSKDSTRDIVKEYIRMYPFIKLVDNPKKIVPIAMNIGIRAARGDIIMRLDAHASYPTNYFSTLVRQLINLRADNVGAACRTDILNKTSKTLAIREVLSNRFGVGNSTFRLGVAVVMEVETVPFGCWRRDVLTVYYTKQMDSLSLRHFIPLLFLFSLVIPLFCSLIWWPVVFVAIVSLFTYLLVLGSISMRLMIQKHLNFGYLLISFIVLHVSYGWGSLRALLKLPFM